MKSNFILAVLALQIGTVILLSYQDCVKRCGLKKTHAQRIVGGEETDERYVAFVSIKREFSCPTGRLGHVFKDTVEKFCSASILSPDFILVAAHCLMIEDKCQSKHKSVYIAADAANIQVRLLYGKVGKELKFDAKSRIIHDEFTQDNNNQNDIALIQLKNEIRFTPEIGPICLGKGDLNKDTILMSYGYGYHLKVKADGETERLLDKKLRMEKEKWQPLSECQKWFAGKNSYIDGMHLCAIGETGGIEHGDSGGPLVRHENGVAFQVGISSLMVDILLGGPKPTVHQFDIFTGIEKYCPWIEKNSGVKCMDIGSTVNWNDNDCKEHLTSKFRFHREIAGGPKNDTTLIANVPQQRLRRSNKPIIIHGKVLCHYWDAIPEEQPWPNSSIELWDEDSHILGDTDDLLGATKSHFDGTFQLIARNNENEWDGIEPYLLIRHYCLAGDGGMGNNCSYVTRRLLDEEEAAGKKETIIHIGRITPFDTSKWAQYKYETKRECDD